MIPTPIEPVENLLQERSWQQHRSNINWYYHICLKQYFLRKWEPVDGKRFEIFKWARVKKNNFKDRNCFNEFMKIGVFVC